MAKKTKKTCDLSLPIYQLKISLQRIDPMIWRRVQMDDCSLDELHEVIQTSMGWEGEHMHAFDVEGEQYAYFEDADPYEYHDSRKVRLSDLVEQRHTRFHYDYDFGDDWKHLIEIEKTLPAEEGVRYPRCVEGERACPPEDCGGPYGYPYFLEKIQDPKHEEHGEMLEWIGEEFDPEKFDLDAVNKGLRDLRRWLGRRRGKYSPQAAFAKSELVKAKPGVVHDRYPDIPLGGWVGTVKRIAWLTPIAYGVRWTMPTLDQAHPVYLKRCRRDRMRPSQCWLNEGQLEAAADETPTAMEQPADILTKPLSADEFEDRIRMLFGLTSDDALPKAGEQAQRRFLDYLKAHLSFPFKAEYVPTTAIGPRNHGEVTVRGFADPPVDRKAGIVCEARQKEHVVLVPLAGLQASEGDPNCQYVDDYTCWMWDAQEYAGGEPEESGPPQFPIGTVAYYGPDDKTTTKIVAGVIKEEGAAPILKRWVATDVITNPKVLKEMDRFFKKYGVTRIGMSEGNMGCPHEEGKDFPVGGDCPFCPWWKGKQGSGAKE